MSETDGKDRVAARCTDCGSVYAAYKRPDGDVTLIGTASCTCGSSQFTALEESDDLAPKIGSETD